MNIRDYTYELPANRIAEYPLPERDQAKLLVYRHGHIEHSSFVTLADHLPSHSLLIFNNTKVIPARLLFEKETGAHIEIFLLEPVSPFAHVEQAMTARQQTIWQCAIGNLKRWKDGQTLEKKIGNITIRATLHHRDEQKVHFSWTPETTPFAEVVAALGATPLPPYIKRKAEALDAIRYQTIYSKKDGAVAAPTAGLHFTDRVFKSMQRKDISQAFVTLHVSAGTFQPVKSENALLHTMHHEQVVIELGVLKSLLAQSGPIIPVGTTSMRTLESVYWFGVKLLNAGSNLPFAISQDDPYTLPSTVSRKQSLEAVIECMNSTQRDVLIGETSIYLYPGYRFRMCDGLITNFHQPGSTLMLLVAAFIGEDWRHVYQAALDNQYRFLSYGDSSLLLPNQPT